MPIVPGIEHLLFGVVVDLSGEGVLVGEGQMWNGFCVSVGVVGVRHLALLLVVDVDGVQHAADDEAVAVRVAFQTRLPGGLFLHRKVAGIQFADDNHLLLGVVVVCRGVDDPEAGLVHGEVDVRVAPPLPGGGVLVDHVVKEGPSCYVAHLQVVLDDVLGKGSVVVEGTVVHHVARADPVVGKFVQVAPSPCGETTAVQLSQREWELGKPPSTETTISSLIFLDSIKICAYF